MSASPASAPTAGKTPNGTGAPPPRRPPPKKVNPLNARHKPSKQISRPKPAIAPPSNRGEQSIPLGLPPKTFTQASSDPTDVRPADKVYAVKATKKELLQGMRFHVARMISREVVDVTDEKAFERPLKLHRKDPRFQPQGANGSGNGMDIDSKDELLVDEKQREALEAAKMERQRIREEQAKQMAPGAGTASAARRKPQAFKKKVEQVYRADDTPEERKRQQLRYEEALPWHIEDFEEKKIWQGAYEAALSECHVMLVAAEDGKGFRLVPLEKWYRFREKATQKKERMDPEQAERAVQKGLKVPRWLTKNEDMARQLKKEQDNYQKAMLYTRSGEKEATGTNGMDLGDQPEVAEDANEIDFNVDEEFADDEENELFEGDDETKKLAEEKLKKDALNANVFDMKDEKEVDKEEEQQKLLAEVAKRLEKGTRKALLKREKNYDYASDSDEENPYSSSSESEDSETERAREEERKKAEEEAAKNNNKNADPTKPKPLSSSTPKPPSGASSRGNNTPSSRKEKHDSLRVKAIKRPGSPRDSEASGNESSRKRMKVKHGSGGGATGTVTPRERPAPAAGSGNPSRQGSFLGTAGSGSDTDANARSKNPRIKLTLSQRGSRQVSPSASRAASPPANRSPAGGATPVGASGSAGSKEFPTAAEIAAAVPKEGISIQGLLAIFRGRVDKAQNGRFIGEVKKLTRMDARKLLVLKSAAPAGGAPKPA